jgi:Family of unknown function (DUF6758)
VSQDPLCPRCGEAVEPPNLASSDWRCDRHGAVSPLYGPRLVTPELLATVASSGGVPMWLPWPLPAGWVATGAVLVGSNPGSLVAAGVVCSGPGARSGPAELVLVSEDPGVGLGAGYARLPGPDAGPSVFAGAPTTRVLVGQHETPLWEVGGPPDRSIYVGEADGRWLWAIAWPMEVGLVLHDGLTLVDLRDPGLTLDIPSGALSPRWRPGHVQSRGAE